MMYVVFLWGRRIHTPCSTLEHCCGKEERSKMREERGGKEGVWKEKGGGGGRECGQRCVEEEGEEEREGKENRR